MIHRQGYHMTFEEWNKVFRDLCDKFGSEVEVKKKKTNKRKQPKRKARPCHVLPKTGRPQLGRETDLQGPTAPEEGSS
jgi:hypothetical protein